MTLIGSGMIVNDQILPSLYHLQRTGAVGDIWICATSSRRLRSLAQSDTLNEAFPGQSFRAFPDLSEPPDRSSPELYKEVIAQAPRDSLVIVAIPEQMHHPVVMHALAHHQHVLCVKPLALKHAHADEMDKAAKERGLLVAVEYHKRFDRRALEARLQYRRGRFGQFRCGEAKLIEPFYYRHSNFQSWFTKDKTDPFTYVGCHYVDMVYFITGLRPTQVAVRGVTGRFPNGNEAWMWSNGQVVFENGGVLSVTNGLGYPDIAGGGNDQGMCLFCEGPESGATIKHDDQFRGVTHGYLSAAPGNSPFKFINPDYFRLVPWQGPGLKPVGYGYESIEASVAAVNDLVSQTRGLTDTALIARRQQLLEQIDEQGILATAANSAINELVVEAGRLSIMNDGRNAIIEYSPKPRVRLA